MGREIRLLAIVVIASLLAVVAPGAGAASPGNGYGIEVLSNRADLVSGDDALVALTLPSEMSLDDVSIDLDGRDTADSFALRDDGRILGRLEGLAPGDNQLAVLGPDGSGARLKITNHPVGGPIFSGPQVQPWICTTADNGLGEPQDEQCNAPTRVDWVYMSVEEGGFTPYDPENPPPDDDIATTTTDHGVTVPFIVRQETGTQNRGIYRVAVLADPDQPFEPWAPYEGWNGKLFYPFGASCGVNHTQGSAQNVQREDPLSRGFMVATSSLNVLGSNCNTVTSAESMMMLKEHVVDHFGEVRYTFGNGSSGGSIGQHMVANNYPGLLDGITVGAAYPDNISTGMEVFDCHMLYNYFVRTSPHLWANVGQQTAVTGHGTSPATCTGWELFFSSVSDPRNGCGIPDEEHYDPETNPTGCRGTYQDFSESIYGKRPASMWIEPEDEYGGFAKGLYDNVGVAYGLEALQQGLITTEQFVDLNEKIGGFDIDFNFTAERASADPGVVETIHRAGQLVDTGQLGHIPMIDSRSTGNVDPLTIHTMHHSFAMEERLVKVHGHADNHAIWRGSAPAEPFDVMDAWLSAIEADQRDVPLAQKVVDNRPSEAVDQCFFAGQRFTERDTCDAIWPYYGAPRIAAGMPSTHDIIKCRLKPLDRDGDWGPLPFTDAQWERLEAAFPDGMCDWSQPSVDYRPSEPWLTYAPGPGGTPLGDAPTATTF